jgi:hypothetical protein
MSRQFRAIRNVHAQTKKGRCKNGRLDGHGMQNPLDQLAAGGFIVDDHGSVLTPGARSLFLSPQVLHHRDRSLQNISAPCFERAAGRASASPFDRLAPQLAHLRARLF